MISKIGLASMFIDFIEIYDSSQLNKEIIKAYALKITIKMWY